VAVLLCSKKRHQHSLKDFDQLKSDGTLARHVEWADSFLLKLRVCHVGSNSRRAIYLIIIGHSSPLSNILCKIKISPRRPTHNEMGKRRIEDFVTEVAWKFFCKPLLCVTGDSEDTRDKLWGKNRTVQREANYILQMNAKKSEVQGTKIENYIYQNYFTKKYSLY
jgi:hypothetical protein